MDKMTNKPKQNKQTKNKSDIAPDRERCVSISFELFFFLQVLLVFFCLLLSAEFPVAFIDFLSVSRNLSFASFLKFQAYHFPGMCSLYQFPRTLETGWGRGVRLFREI